MARSEGKDLVMIVKGSAEFILRLDVAEVADEVGVLLGNRRGDDGPFLFSWLSRRRRHRVVDVCHCSLAGWPGVSCIHVGYDP